MLPLLLDTWLLTFVTHDPSTHVPTQLTNELHYVELQENYLVLIAGTPIWMFVRSSSVFNKYVV